MAAKNQKPAAQKALINIGGKDYPQDQLTQEQLTMCNHILDLTRKMDGLQFNFEQMRVGRDAFVAALEASVKFTDSQKKEVA